MSATHSPYSYDDIGRRSLVTRGNGGLTGWLYDAASRVVDHAHDLPGSAANDNWTDLAYTPANQIYQHTVSNAAYASSLPVAFTDTYAVDGLNRYTSAGGVSPTYDGRGNMTNDGTKTYAYDAMNRMTSAGSATLYNDPLGRLWAINQGSNWTYFLYAGAGMQVIAEYNNSGPLRRYVHGSGGDGPVAWYEGSTTSDRRYLYADERGSVAAVEGASVTINTYDEYGIPGAGNLGRFQYTGQMWMPEFSLYYYKARVYNQELGRFMQTDPIGYKDQMNLYALVGADPINMRDPAGTTRCPNETPVEECDRVRAAADEASQRLKNLGDLIKAAIEARKSGELTAEQEKVINDIYSAYRDTSDKKLRELSKRASDAAAVLNYDSSTMLKRGWNDGNPAWINPLSVNEIQYDSVALLGPKHRQTPFEQVARILAHEGSHITGWLQGWPHWLGMGVGERDAEVMSCLSFTCSGRDGYRVFY